MFRIKLDIFLGFEKWVFLVKVEFAVIEWKVACLYLLCMGLLALELTESEYFLFDGELVYVSLL